MAAITVLAKNTSNTCCSPLHREIKCEVHDPTEAVSEEHEDSHYAAAIFRYEREYASQVREHARFLCIDDKHRAKVGEPGFPVAAAERGRKVIVAHDTSFEVGDHDFTKFSLIPSVVLRVDIPEDVSESWYRGQVTITLKDAAFEPSSPMQHTTELLLEGDAKPILFLYSDGGPDHRVTYISAQTALIALFRSLDLDYVLPVLLPAILGVIPLRG